MNVTSYADEDAAYWRDTDRFIDLDPDDAFLALLDELADLPLSKRPAFLAEQSDEMRERFEAEVEVSGDVWLAAVEQTIDEWHAAYLGRTA